MIRIVILTVKSKYIEYKPGSKGKAGIAFNTDNPVDFSGAKNIHIFPLWLTKEEKQ